MPEPDADLPVFLDPDSPEGRARLDARQAVRTALGSDASDDRATRLHLTTDAEVWASEFMDVLDGLDGRIDGATVCAWFANAIETGRQAGRRPDRRVAPAEALGRVLSILSAAEPGSHPAAILGQIADMLIEQGYGHPVQVPGSAMKRFVADPAE